MNRHALPLTLALTATAAPAQMAITLEREPGSQPICAVLQMPRDDGTNADTRVLFTMIERVWEIRMLEARLTDGLCRCEARVYVDFRSVVDEADKLHREFRSASFSDGEALADQLIERQRQQRIEFVQECGEGS
ncbi:MAG: hypothetical protein AAGA32_12040 [Pseudomonadota bacterium]